MSGFSADWLALREPHDLRARNPAVLEAVAAFFALHSQVRVVDLACGTGSTLRALSAAFAGATALEAGRQRSRVARARRSDASRSHHYRGHPRSQPRPRIRTRRNHRSGRRPRPCSIWSPSAGWSGLRIAIVAREIPFYAALSYDGRIDLTPPDPLDNAIMNGVNAHQRTDKGFGPALGPDAAAFRHRALRSAGLSGGARHIGLGHRSRCRRHANRNFVRLGKRGVRYRRATDASKPRPGCTRRRDFVAAGASSLEVGHIDFFASPQRHALSRQVAIEQHIVVDLVARDRHPRRLVGALQRR